ncbi:hypothetical protein PHYBOEH_008216 [Phytophthora boehmeriae]|uniref:Bzip transcription factor n=1 Tax=Phytophthora boehmeriae TaxID=109152 RepID=A0A8T1W752_9STRA|nr:hypothetical protein PHYBOEH_008216 [Phytophthora boehmeriae]
MNLDRVLRPPHCQLFSDDVISSVKQHSRPDYSVIDVSSVNVERRPSNHVTIEEPECHEGQAALILNDFKRGDPPTSRERNRVYQARYKLKQKALVDDLNLSIQKLRDDIMQLEKQRLALEKQRLALSCSPLTDSTVWNVAAEYFRLFRHGFNKPESANDALVCRFDSVNHLAFLQQTMTSNVMIETGSGIEAMMESWSMASRYFDDIDCQLMCLENGPRETLVGTLDVRIDVTLQTLRHVFPHLIEGEKLTPLAEKMVGHQLYLSSSVYLEWDPLRRRVSSVKYNADFMTPLLQLLGNLEDVSHVFDDANITPDCKVVPLLLD